MLFGNILTLNMNRKSSNDYATETTRTSHPRIHNSGILVKNVIHMLIFVYYYFLNFVLINKEFFQIFIANISSF